MAVIKQFLVPFGMDFTETVGAIPKVLAGVVPDEFRGVDTYGNTTFVLSGSVRIATFDCFYAVEDEDVHILVWGRPPKMQQNQNDALDVFGSMAYANVSIPFKVDPSFLGAKILEKKEMNHFVVEQNDDGSFAMMLGHLVKVSLEALRSGVVEGKTFVTTPEVLIGSGQPMTAKLKASLASLGYMVA